MLVEWKAAQGDLLCILIKKQYRCGTIGKPVSKIGGREIMIESKWAKFKRTLRQLLCFHHDWYVWVNGKKKTCNKCDKTVEINK